MTLAKVLAQVFIADQVRWCEGEVELRLAVECESRLRELSRSDRHALMIEINCLIDEHHAQFPDDSDADAWNELRLWFAKTLA